METDYNPPRMNELEQTGGGGDVMARHSCASHARHLMVGDGSLGTVGSRNRD